MTCYVINGDILIKMVYRNSCPKTAMVSLQGKDWGENCRVCGVDGIQPQRQRSDQHQGHPRLDQVHQQGRFSLQDFDPQVYVLQPLVVVVSIVASGNCSLRRKNQW